MSSQYSLHISAELKNLETIRRFVIESATALRVEPNIIPKLQLAVDEAATNIILHGYHNQGEGHLEIELEQVEHDLIIRLRDEAAPFNPTIVPSPDINLPLSQRKPGGMGVYLIRRCMDEMTHRLTTRGGNELTLIKREVCGKS
ncbi:MAG: ATP-binding protein [Anaerolineae bacterium]